MATGACGLMLAGCSSMSWLPGSSSGPTKATVQLQSQPAGAQADTSLGPGCRTPCAVEVAAPGDFTVSFSLDGFLPQTVPVRVKPAESMFGDASLVPNPVYAQLQPAPPPPSKHKPKSPPPKPHAVRSKPAPSTASPPPPLAPPPPQAPSSAFPPPPPPGTLQR